MILNKYIIIKLFLLIIFCSYGIDVQAQNQTILIFDPHQVSNNFQNSFHQLSEDSIYIADTIDEKINNYDALFLFIDYPYILSQVEGNSLIEYLNLNKPIYLSTTLYFQNIDSVTFWNHIGIDWYAELLVEVHVNYVAGVDTAFTKGIFIDTSFISSGIPYIEGEVAPILDGIDTVSINLSTTFIPTNESLNVIIDLYNLIHHSEFLERVLIHFGLRDPNSIINEDYDQPNTFYLFQNYPNPFNPSTKIKFTIPTVETHRNVSLQTTLKVYDVLGNEIATLVNEEKPAGSYEVEFSAKGLPSGIYFYQLKAGRFMETKKMVLIR
jgi:Secretion system C-terminal sorting domain